MGNTAHHQPPATRSTVHPHARGEHESLGRLIPQPPGSSPRTWGTPSLARSERARNSVHPHARGEHFSLSSRTSPNIGSSPRTWGTHFRATRWMVCSTVHPHARGEHGESYANDVITDRLIPTHVGNTNKNVSRGCNPTGSSPRTWGTRIKTYPGVAILPVHPHARGEHNVQPAGV